MSRATLKRSLGEAGAFFDDSHGEDNLYAVLLALASNGPSIDTKVASPAGTGVILSKLVDVPSKIGTLYTYVGTTGSSGQTDIRVRVNGTLIAGTITFDNTEAGGLKKALAYDYELEAGDLVEVDLTAIATAVADVAASLKFQPVTVEV